MQSVIQEREISFNFVNKTQSLDWKLMNTINVEEVEKNLDIQCLQKCLSSLIHADVSKEFSDQSFVKLFKVAQLTIEYLLFSQTVLNKQITKLTTSSENFKEEIRTLKEKSHDDKRKIEEIKRECHRRKLLLIAQQNLLNSQPSDDFACPYCVKKFMNKAYLLSHLERRHPRSLDVIVDKENRQVPVIKPSFESTHLINEPPLDKETAEKQLQMVLTNLERICGELEKLGAASTKNQSTIQETNINFEFFKKSFHREIKIVHDQLNSLNDKITIEEKISRFSRSSVETKNPITKVSELPTDNYRNNLEISYADTGLITTSDTEARRSEKPLKEKKEELLELRLHIGDKSESETLVGGKKAGSIDIEESIHIQEDSKRSSFQRQESLNRNNNSIELEMVSPIPEENLISYISDWDETTPEISQELPPVKNVSVTTNDFDKIPTHVETFNKVKSDPLEMEKYRNMVLERLDLAFQSYGIDLNQQTMSNAKYSTFLVEMDENRTLMEKKYTRFAKIRDLLEYHVTTEAKNPKKQSKIEESLWSNSQKDARNKSKIVLKKATEVVDDLTGDEDVDLSKSRLMQ